MSELFSLLLDLLRILNLHLAALYVSILFQNFRSIITITLCFLLDKLRISSLFYLRSTRYLLLDKDITVVINSVILRGKLLLLLILLCRILLLLLCVLMSILSFNVISYSVIRLWFLFFFFLVFMFNIIIPCFIVHRGLYLHSNQLCIFLFLLDLLFYDQQVLLLLLLLLLLLRQQGWITPFSICGELNRVIINIWIFIEEFIWEQLSRTRSVTTGLYAFQYKQFQFIILN
jgi:hypothetical protein